MLPDGSPDGSFGIGGKVLVPYDLVTDGTDFAQGIVEDSAGRLVVAGGAVVGMVARPVMTRLLGHGTLDASFGALGKKVYDIGTDSAVFSSVALQGTQIVSSGLSAVGTDQDIFAARIEVDLIFANGFE
jgi:hypothetical protein